MEYYIVSVKHTNKGMEHILFWGAESRGYTPVVGAYIGAYDKAEALTLNDGDSTMAVPVEAVSKLLSTEPVYRASSPFAAANERFYDQRGPVVDNTADNWEALIAARLPSSSTKKVLFKGLVHKRKRQSYSPQAEAPQAVPA